MESQASWRKLIILFGNAFLRISDHKSVRKLAKSVVWINSSGMAAKAQNWEKTFTLKKRGWTTACAAVR